jgi:5-methylcytosine-specific restriction endonuclease McrA
VDALVSRKVRDRDAGACQVPGCSHRGEHAHHVLFRSRGGGDEQENLMAL